VLRRIQANVETGSQVLPGLTEDASGVAMRFYSDHLDHAWFPRSGHRALVNAYAGTKDLGAARDYQRLAASYTGVSSWGAHTFNVTVSAGTSFSSNVPPYDGFSLGGPLTLSAYQLNEFSGRRMAFSRLLYYNRALPLPDLLGSGIYFGGSLEAGKVRNRFDTLADTDTKYSASIFLGADTFAGPAFFGLGGAPGGRYSIYLLLGVP
jgi:NTE family protein